MSLNGQDIKKQNFASGLEGHYNGAYISRKKDDFGTKTMFLKYVNSSTLVSEGSPFGNFEIKINDQKKDTLHFTSSLKDMKIKYVKSSKRITIIGNIDGAIVNFSGRFSHKNQQDLDRKKIANDSLLNIQHNKLKYFGVYYGTLEIAGSDKKMMDTIVVTSFEKVYNEGNYSVADKMAAISSKGGHFKEFTTNVKLIENGVAVISHKNNNLNMKLSYESKTIYFEEKYLGLKFQGIEIQGKSSK